MEATAQATQRKITLESLDLVHARRPDIQVFNELLVQYRQGRGQKIRQVVPDNMVVVHDQPIKADGSFDVPLQPVGPFWVMEYVSKHNKRKDYEESLQKYERALKVPYYLIFYPDNQELTLFHLRGQKYVSVTANVAGRHPIEPLEIEVALQDGWVRYWYQGKLLPLPADLQEQLDEARQRLVLLQAQLDAAEAQARRAEDQARAAAEQTRAAEAQTRASEARKRASSPTCGNSASRLPDPGSSLPGLLICSSARVLAGIVRGPPFEHRKTEYPTLSLVVQKFGGSSVATAERIMAAARRAIRAKQAGNQVIVVVSARGDTTDELIELAREISEQPPAREMDMLLSTGEQISIALMAMAIQSAGPAGHQLHRGPDRHRHR